MDALCDVKQQRDCSEIKCITPHWIRTQSNGDNVNSCVSSLVDEWVEDCFVKMCLSYTQKCFIGFSFSSIPHCTFTLAQVPRSSSSNHFVHISIRLNGELNWKKNCCQCAFVCVHWKFIEIIIVERKTYIQLRNEMKINYTWRSQWFIKKWNSTRGTVCQCRTHSTSTKLFCPHVRTTHKSTEIKILSLPGFLFRLTLRSRIVSLFCFYFEWLVAIWLFNVIITIESVTRSSTTNEIKLSMFGSPWFLSDS